MSLEAVAIFPGSSVLILLLFFGSEILKQVWDLSDQDSDSMLSVREFCIALYLMERYRDGRPLPKTLPNGMFEEALFSASGQPAAAYGHATWRPTPGMTI